VIIKCACVQITTKMASPTRNYSVFPSSCNIRLQEREPCHPIKLQDLNFALWLAHTVDAIATGSCKNLEKRCTVDFTSLRTCVSVMRVRKREACSESYAIIWLRAHANHHARSKRSEINSTWDEREVCVCAKNNQSCSFFIPVLCACAVVGSSTKDCEKCCSFWVSGYERLARLRSPSCEKAMELGLGGLCRHNFGNNGYQKALSIMRE